jgi:hypothetical protein
MAFTTRARIGAQHVALVGDADAGDFLAQVIHRFRCAAAEEIVVALAANAADVVVAFAHLVDDLADFLGRVLKVGVEGDDDLSAGVFEAGHDRHVLAGIGGEQYGAGDVRAPLVLFAEQCRRAITAAVVDEHHLVRGFESVECRVQAGEQGRQTVLFVIDGNDDGDFWRDHGGLRRG